jgi:predicted nucleic acid-binding protein
MRIYLDNCVFNRPFDDQGYLRVRLEAEAKLYVQDQIKAGNMELVWSYILDFENAQNPFQERRMAIAQWKNRAVVNVLESPVLLETARKLLERGVKPKDALHIASAISGNAEFFLSTDDKLLNKLSNLSGISALNPIDFIGAVDDYDNGR